jgi:hypothetical protein
MLSISSAAALSCTGNIGRVSRACPLFRGLSEWSGLIAPNSTETERTRRFLARHVPSGAVPIVADALDAKPSRLNREMEGRALLSVDALTGFTFTLKYEDRLRLFAHVLAPFGFSPMPIVVRDLDDSGAGL